MGAPSFEMDSLKYYVDISGTVYEITKASADAVGATFKLLIKEVQDSVIAPVAPDIVSPGVVTSFVAASGDEQALMSWVNPTDSDFEGVIILHKIGSFPIDRNDGTLVYNGGDETAFTDINLTNDIEHFYSIFAYDSVPNYSLAAQDSTIPADVTAPSSPTNFAIVSQFSNELSLSWVNPTDSDFAGVTIRRDTVSAPATPTAGDFVYTGTDTSVIDAGLTNDVEYFYSIFAFDEIPNYSTIVSASYTPIEHFLASWTTTTSSESITLPLMSTGVYSAFVDWGDGTALQAINAWDDANASHVYANAGVYDVNIIGTIEGFRFNNVGDKTKINVIKTWGPLKLLSDSWFYGCTNLTITAMDIPDITAVTNMQSAFKDCNSVTTIPNMDTWNISAVTSLFETFYNCAVFNQDLNSWNTGLVTSMSNTFRSCPLFDGNITSWNTISVTDMSLMFNGASVFNQAIGSWNVSSVNVMNQLFDGCSTFNQPLDSWVVSAVTRMDNMLRSCLVFNQPLNSWNTNAVTNMQGMLNNCQVFNQPLNLWNTALVTNMAFMFNNCLAFDQSLDNWNVGAVSLMNNIFELCAVFNQDLNSWNTVNATNMSAMFNRALVFNGDITSWITSSVTDMSFMFNGCTVFNQPIGNWTTTALTQIQYMFRDAVAFNQPLNLLNTSSVTNMQFMFDGATIFDRDISDWDISSVVDMQIMFNQNALSIPNYDALLDSWSKQATQPNVIFGGGNSIYAQSKAVIGRAALITNGWTITDGGEDTNDLFISTFTTTTASESVTFPLDSSATGLNFTIDWGDGTISAPITTYNDAALSHTYAVAGDHVILIDGTIKGLRFNNVGDKTKFSHIGRWGELALLNNAWFYGCSNLKISATDIPDISLTTTMYSAFRDCTLIDTIPNLETWNVAHITLLHFTFSSCSNFNHNIDAWNIGSATTLSNLFSNCFKFNQPLNSWNVSAVNAMNSMFNGCILFNQPLNSWIVTLVTTMQSMFAGSNSFNQPLNLWNVSAVTNMTSMFDGCSAFNGDVTSWVTTSLTEVLRMFRGCAAFNQNIDGWNVSLIASNMQEMFSGCTVFNQSLNSWNVSLVISFKQMFQNCAAFDGNITSWVTTAATDLQSMLSGCSVFNQDISGWNVSLVTAMNSMFNSCSLFNQPIGVWNVTSAITNIDSIFISCSVFNQPVGSWDVSNVTLIGSAFRDCTLFNQDLSNWNFSSVTNIGDFLKNVTLSIQNYDALLLSLDSQTLQPSLVFNGGLSKYAASAAVIARASLISNDTWTITDGGEDLNDLFISTFTTTTASESVTFPLHSSATGLNFTIDWGDGTVSAPITTYNDAALSHIYAVAGDHVILINGVFKGIVFGNTGDKTKFSHIGKWGSLELLSDNWFNGCNALIISATDTPTIGTTSFFAIFSSCSALTDVPNIDTWDISLVTSLQSAFNGCLVFNQSLNSWNTISVTNMSYVFFNCFAFNQDINSWNVSSVTTMNRMFTGCTVFNQPLNSWVVSSVTAIPLMFNDCIAFNQPLNLWDVSAVIDMSTTFKNCQVFNQDINSWNVSAVTLMNSMFFGCVAFNQPLNTWVTTSVTDINNMFFNCTVFNQDVNNFNTSLVTNMAATFKQCTAFNKPLNLWNTGLVTNMSSMFRDCLVFNQDISSWVVSAVTTMNSMLQNCSAYNQPLTWTTTALTDIGFMFSGCTVFDQPLNSWNVSSVTVFHNLFTFCSAFNQPLNSWNVGLATTFSAMFQSCVSFNQDLNSWITTNVTTMNSMFESCSVFDGNITTWNVSKVTDFTEFLRKASVFNQDISGWAINALTNVNMTSMFRNALLFDQDLSAWDMSQVTAASTMFLYGTLSIQNYDNMLVAWDAQVLQPNVVVHFGNSKYSSIAAGNARANMIAADGWTITDGGLTSFDSTWTTTTDNQSVLLNFANSAVDFNIDWGDGSDNDITVYNDAALNHLYVTAGTFNIVIRGKMGALNMRFASNTEIDVITRWGPYDVVSNRNFWGCSNLTITATDIPVISSIDLSSMFVSCNSITTIPNISDWNVSNVISFESMFQSCWVFNSPLSGWDTSSTTVLKGLFLNCLVFNQPLNTWVTGSVTNMSAMLQGCSAFNQDISDWNVSSVTTMSTMMAGVTLSTANYDAVLIDWDGQILQPNVVFDAGNSKYTGGGVAATARANMVTNDLWTITDGGIAA
ncbi:MAG: BspA family leucine-rich repeat surface protein [Bacteroidia bacterium]|nr:BspA family leucine-rich repeat surface protein [Bacteroidia bacterium]